MAVPQGYYLDVWAAATDTGPPILTEPLGMLDASLERLPKVGSATMQKFFSQTARLRMHPSMSKTHVRTKQPNQNTNQCTWGSGEPKGLAPRQTSKSWLSGSFPKAVLPLSALLKQPHQTPSSVTSPQHAMLFQLLMYTSQICAYVRLCWREHSWYVQSNTKQTTA